MFKIIPTMSTGLVQTFGKFSRLCKPGIRFYIPYIQQINLVSNKLCQNQCNIEVRTADKVFPTLDITIQYKIYPQDTDKAYFQLNDPYNQMVSYTDNVVRNVASHLTLDQIYQSQSHIADAVMSDVGPKMKKGGFTIESVQIRSIKPPQQVLAAMNQINASERRKIAAKNDGEAAKIKAILLAQADAKEKSLRGKGIAQMRTNIIQGWIESVVQMATKTNQHPQDILDFMIKVLQQETLETMSKQANTKVIFTDKGLMQPDKSQKMTAEALKQTLMAASEASSYKQKLN